MEQNSGLFAILISVGLVLGPLILIATIIIFSKQRKNRRTEGIRQLAMKLGLQFFGSEPPPIPGMAEGWRLAKRGRRHRKHNFLTGSYRGQVVSYFDYSFMTGSGKNSRHHRQSVALVQSVKGQIPLFTMTPEGLGARLGSALGGQDIDFDNDHEFSKTFHLRGEDEAAVRRLFTPPLRSYFTSHNGICVEGKDSTMALYRDNKMLKPEDIPPFLSQAVEIAELLGSQTI
jgi:hypothetical protein